MLSPPPPGWVQLRLGAIATVRVGQAIKRDPAPSASSWPQLQSTNIGWDALDLSELLTTELTPAQADRVRLKRGDILLARSSGTAGRIGRPALWRGEIEDCCFHSGLIRVRPGPHVDARYLYYFLYYEALRGEFGQHSTGTTNLQHLTTKTVEDWHVPIPSLPGQQRIADALAELLSRLDSAEASQAGARDNLPRLWDSVRDAVADGSLAGRQIDVRRPLLEVADLISGLSAPQPTDRGLKRAYIRVADVSSETIKLSDVHHVTFRSHQRGSVERRRLQVGDLLVVRQNGALKRVGQAALWNHKQDDTVYQDHLVRVRPGPLILPRFLELAWNAPSTLGRLQAQARTSVGNFSVRQSDLTAMTIPIPTLPLQAELVGAADRLKGSLSAPSALLDHTFRSNRELRLSVLTKAFTGNLVVGGAADAFTESTVLHNSAAAASDGPDYFQQEFDFR